MHSAFILAAGFGTRLRPLTTLRPKPLVPVCGVELLRWSLALCARHGLQDVVVNAHYLGDQVAAWEGEHEGCRIRVSLETPDILGTGGGLRAVRDSLAQRFVVLNADVLHAVDLQQLLDAVPEGGGAMALRPSEDAERYGVVAADATGTVVRLSSVAATDPEGAIANDTHFTGIHALDRDALDRVPEGFACIVRSAYRELVPLRRVAGVRYTGPWLDAGNPTDYLATNLAVLTGEVRGALDPFARAGFARDASGQTHGDAGLVRGVTLRGPVWVGRGARVSPGATLDHAIVGHGASLTTGTHLQRAVVWDGVDVPAGVFRDTTVYAPEGAHTP